MAVIFTLSEIHKNLYCLHFKSQKELCLTFLRYQEFYESSNPNFQNNKFTIKEYKKWYRKNLGEGKFSYVEDWSGFNIPMNVIDKVIKLGIADPNKHDQLMEYVYHFSKDNSKGNCYLVGYYGNNKNILKHEIAHGLFYVNKEYKKEILDVVKSVPQNHLDIAKKEIIKLGYAQSSVIDEIHAYSVENRKSFKDVLPVSYEKYARKMNQIFEKYAKNNI